TFFIRLFVPESERWQEERSRGSTSHWATQDLLGVLVGACGGIGIIVVWAMPDLSLPLRIGLAVPAVLVATLGYLYPVVRCLERAAASGGGLRPGQTLGRLLLGAGLGGVALLGTWASIQQVPTWADETTQREYRETGQSVPNAKSLTQICSSAGAVLATIAAAVVGGWLGRRVTYCILCLGSLGATLLLFQVTPPFDGWFLFATFLAGGMTASFYGWLPLYLPELFPTKVRATGQGFSFNFGRIIAAIGALQGSYLIKVVYQG